MDTLWTRRSNASKLSLSTATAGTNGGPPSNDNSTRNYSLGRRHGDTSSHSTKNPFNAMSPTSLTSPATGASTAFGLGSGAFASFGSAKAPKTLGGALDFSSVVGAGAKTPVAEKSLKELGTKLSKTSLTDSKASLSDSKTPTPPPSHQLRHSWVFWFRPPISKSNGFVEYEKTLHAIAGFSTIEEFFQVYKHLKRPSSLLLVSDYHIFKKGIRPIWEDEDNKKGGKWIVRLKKGVADRYWEELVFAIIGDQFADTSEEVCGAVLSVRNGEDILSIWTRDNSGRVLKIKETMKRILAFPPETKIEWKSHDSSLQQRREIDEARKDKSNQHNHSSSTAPNGDHSSVSVDKKQNS